MANELRHKRPVPAKRYDNVTILFSGIVGFNAFCSKHASAEGAIKIVNLLNDIYTKFDILTDSRKNPYVYKVSHEHSGLQRVFIKVPCKYTKVQYKFISYSKSAYFKLIKRLLQIQKSLLQIYQSLLQTY